MPDEAPKTVRDIEITAPDKKVAYEKIKLAVSIMLSSLFPILWADCYRSYMKWASSFLQEKGRARLRLYLTLAATLTFSLCWLYFGGSFFLLASIIIAEAAIITAFSGLVFVWIFFHLDYQLPAMENKTLAVLIMFRNMAQTARAGVKKFRRVILIAAALGLVATFNLFPVSEKNPFPEITLLGDTDSAGRQLVFVIVMAFVFDITMTVLCWNGFKIEDRSPLINSDKTISFLAAKDPTAKEFFLGANGKGYIPPVPVSFDFAKFERNFMIFGGPDVARENMVNWLLMCAFAEPNTLAVCIDGGRNDDIAFKHLRNVPGVFIAEINDAITNTYSQIIRWVCWLADLADEAFMRRHGARQRWRPENTRIVVFCDPEVTDIVMKKNLRKVKTERRTGRAKVVWQHPLYDIVEPMEKLFAYGKSHNITFVCVAKHQYHQLSVPKEKRDAFYNIVYNYKVNDVLPDGTEGWITVKTPPFKHTFGLNFRDDFIVGTAPEIRNEELAAFITQQMQFANSSTLELAGRAGDQVPSYPIIQKQKMRKNPIIGIGKEWTAQPRDMNRDTNFNPNGARTRNSDNGHDHNSKHAETELELQEE